MPLPTPPHTKVKTERSMPDGTTEISSYSMTEKLSSVKQEISQNMKTTADRLAADVIACLQHVTFKETEELTIKITVDKETGEPRLITKTWLINKEFYGR